MTPTHPAPAAPTPSVADARPVTVASAGIVGEAL